MKCHSIFLYTFIVIALLSCSNNSDDTTTNQPEVIEISESSELFDVAYGTDPNQKYDLYLPENRNTVDTKVIVLIHGGGWTSGDKDDLKFIYDYLKLEYPGYAIANLNYTLASLSVEPIPLQTDDIATFINQIKEKKNEYAINPEFAFIGTSAGAHLSMLYAYRFDQDKDVKIVCNVVGPTNFLHESYVSATDPETIELFTNVQTIYHRNIVDDPDFFNSISPYFHVEASSAPTISFYGGQDLLVPEEQGVFLKEVLDNAGVTNQYILYPTEGHGWGDANLIDTFQKIKTFLQQNNF